jgi:transposase
VIEAISWKYRTGTPWRELPERFGPWQTAYERLTRWSADGTWAKLLARGQADADAAGELDWLVAADSTMVRVHQHGASARRAGGNAATVPAGVSSYVSMPAGRSVRAGGGCGGLTEAKSRSGTESLSRSWPWP